MMLIARFVGLALALFLVPAASALYSAGGTVKILNSKNFNSAVLNSDVPAVVEFFAPWCGHCKNLAPTYQRVAGNLHGIVTVGAVDCDVESNKALCGQFGVQGFPTLKVFPGDKPKSGSKSPNDYQGPRSAKGIAVAATAGLHAKLIHQPSTAADFDKFRTVSAVPKVVLFTDKPKTTTLFKSLSMRFRDRLAFAEVRDTKGAIASTFGVASSPALLVIPSEGEPTTYEGKLKAKDLVEFLKSFAGLKGGGSGKGDKPASGKPAAGGKPAEGANKPFAEKPKKAEADKAQEAEPQHADPVSGVVELRASDLAGLLEEEDVWLLGVFEGAEGLECTEAAANLTALADSLGGMAKVGRINASAVDAATLSEHGIEAAPPGGCGHALALKPFGEQSEPEEAFSVFSGEPTAKAMQAFVMDGFPAGAVAPLTADSMSAFMGADGGRSPRVLLFTNKEEAPPLFRALASNLQSTGALFGTVHEREAEILANFKIKKVPSMVVAWVSETEEKDPEGRPMMGARLQPYSGPFRYGRMSEFLRFMAGMIAASEDGGGPSAPLAASLPQANTTAHLQQLCAQRLGLCVVAWLNPATGEHLEQLGKLGIVTLKQSGKPLHFVWVDARRQADFGAAFGLRPGDAPTVLMLSPRQKRFAVLEGGLTMPERLDAWLGGVLAGRQRTTPFEDAIPGLAEGGASEAAADAGAASVAQPEPEAEELLMEEEFDLADLMSEEIEDSGTKAERLAQIDAQLKAEAEEKRRQEEAQAVAAAQAAAEAAAAAKAERKRKAKAAKAAAAAAAAANDEL